MYGNVTVEIIEEPAPNTTRFRYPCEERCAGSLVGVNSTKDLKTYPAIRVLNYTGSAIVIVSCVTDQEPYRAHPNGLLGKTCYKGVCKVDFTTNAAAPTAVTFPHLDILCARKADITANLCERENLRIDPYKAGFKHKENGKSLNLYAIRLCFQVLLMPDLSNPKYLLPVKPITSSPIYDQNRVSMKPHIHDTSDQSSPACGNKKIMLFTDKIERTDILVRFYEEDSKGAVVWEDWGVFEDSNIHRKVMISFTTPKYKNQDIDVPVNVFFHLQRRSDGVSSNIIPFQYVPNLTNIRLSMETKKRKIDDFEELYQYLQINEVDSTQNSMISNIDPNGNQPNIAAASNLFVPTQHEQQHQQSTHEPLRQQDYQWPQQQPEFVQSQYLQSNHYHHPHFQQNIRPAQLQSQMDTQRNCLSSYTVNNYSNGTAQRTDQHHINNSMPMPMPMPLSNHNFIQKPFSSNNQTFNQQSAVEVENCLIPDFYENL